MRIAKFLGLRCNGQHGRAIYMKVDSKPLYDYKLNFSIIIVGSKVVSTIKKTLIVSQLHKIKLKRTT